MISDGHLHEFILNITQQMCGFPF